MGSTALFWIMTGIILIVFYMEGKKGRLKMFKFIAKIWIAGEINDWRKEREKRKLEEKNRHKQECDSIAKNLRESKYRDSYLKGMYMVLIGIISVILGAVIFPFISLIGLIIFVVGIIKAIVNLYRANN